MTEQQPPAAPQAQDSPTSPQSAPQPTPAKPSDTATVVQETPLGYVKTHVLEFVNGILHQLHEAAHSGQEPAKVLVPVPGSAVPPGLLAGIERVIEERVKIFDDRVTALEAKLNTSEPTQFSN